VSETKPVDADLIERLPEIMGDSGRFLPSIEEFAIRKRIATALQAVRDEQREGLTKLLSLWGDLAQQNEQRAKKGFAVSSYGAAAKIYSDCAERLRAALERK
jgi:hypothetical protein